MKTELQKCLAGEMFNGKNDELYAMTCRAKKLISAFNSFDYSAQDKKQEILKELFGSIGENVAIDISFHCEYGKNIHIGNNVIINMNCTFVDNNRINIGNKVLIASNVQIYTATHPTEVNERLIEKWDKNSDRAFFNTYALPVNIEDNVWIGGGTIILPNVTIGKNSVIGAGSVVNKSIPANSVAVGNPCRVIKVINQ